MTECTYADVNRCSMSPNFSNTAFRDFSLKNLLLLTECTNKTRMHSSRMYTAGFSGCPSCMHTPSHAHPSAMHAPPHTPTTQPPAMHTPHHTNLPPRTLPCHRCPLPHMTPAMHAPCHAHLSAMHDPCHAHPLCHTCTPCYAQPPLSVNRMTDRQVYVPATSFADGN